jgi:hypothetical protein
MPDMNKNKALNKLPPSTQLLVIASILVVLIFIAVILFPQYKNIERAKEERIAKTILLEEQKKLFPIFAQADSLADIQFEPKLPSGEKNALDRDKISMLSDIFNEIVQKHNMELSQNSLDINYLKNQANSISMDVRFFGDFFDFRDCLISLTTLPFFDSFENIKVITEKSNIKRFSTKILIKINKK